MWDTVLVIVVVGVCAVLLARAAYRQLTGKGSCGCSCSGNCPATKTTDRDAAAGPSCSCPPPGKDQ